MSSFYRTLRDSSLFWAFLFLFLASWTGHLFFEGREWMDDNPTEGGALLDADFWEVFWASTLENWQSEWLQLAAQVTLPAYLIFKGSTQSRDEEERNTAYMHAIMDKLDIDPEEVQRQLPERDREGDIPPWVPLVGTVVAVLATAGLIVLA